MTGLCQFMFKSGYILLTIKLDTPIHDALTQSPVAPIPLDDA